jgi:spermidine/putrescine transport system permease protein
MESWREQPVVFWTFLLPGGLWLLGFFLAPLTLVWLFSFGERSGPADILITGTLDNYLSALDPIYLGLLWKSFWVAALATAIVLVIAFPLALVVSFAPPHLKPLLLMLVILPFWTNLLIRTYAMFVILRDDGIINNALLNVGLISTPIPIMFTDYAITIGLLYAFLPLMVLPLYASLEKLDFRLVEAGFDLYASRGSVLRRIIVPLSKPGIVAGCILVFIPAIGAYVTPTLMGGGKQLMIGNLIALQFQGARNWPFGAALALILMLVVLIALLFYTRNATRQQAALHG